MTRRKVVIGPMALSANDPGVQDDAERRMRLDAQRGSAMLLQALQRCQEAA